MPAFLQYQEMPDVVEAVQWDGTADGGKLIRDFLMHHYKSAKVIVTHEYMGVSVAVVRLDLETRPPITALTMKGQCWLVKGRDGLKVLTSGEFRALYHKKE